MGSKILTRAEVIQEIADSAVSLEEIRMYLATARSSVIIESYVESTVSPDMPIQNWSADFVGVQAPMAVRHIQAAINKLGDTIADLKGALKLLKDDK